MEERIKALEEEIAKLREMLVNVAYLAWNAYHDMKLSRFSDVDDVVRGYVFKEGRD